MTPALILTIALAASLAQSFEVTSIRPNTTSTGRSSERSNPGHVIAENITVSSMLQHAFRVREFQILGGPGWMKTDGYDVNAATGTPKDLNDQELRPYWVSMLIGRFGLKYHPDSKEMSVYALVVAKGGTKLIAHPDTGNTSTNASNGNGKSSLNSTNISMVRLAEMLSGRMGQQVIDRTSLEGVYDLKLEWAPNPSAESTIPSIFTALQEQLGLKLESTKAPVEMIVIDSLERPSEN